jgi:serine protease AprX
MFCNDPSISYLKKFGYNVVRFPKANIAPLQIITKKGNVFENIGNISTLLSEGANITLPKIQNDIPSASFSGNSTNELSSAIGLTILGDIIKAMGGNKIGLGTHYEKARTITFEFLDVTEDSIEVIELDQYLTDAEINPFSKHLTKLLESDDVYVITSVIKSDKIGVSGTAKDQKALAIDVPVVTTDVGGNVTVDKSSDKESSVVFQGESRLAFGFKAVRLTYKDGKYVAFKTVEAGANAMSTEINQDDDGELLATDSPMIELNFDESAELFEKPFEFDPDQLDKSVIAIPLLNEIMKDSEKIYDVIIDVNFAFKGGRAEARKKIEGDFDAVADAELDVTKSNLSHQYLFAKIKGKMIKELIRKDQEDKNPAIYKIWIDFEVSAFISKSVSTVKADAARYSFSALGENITWAVIDSGIDFEHSHFSKYSNKSDLYHLDLSGSDDPFNDAYGHGTHVAGILAGEWPGNDLDPAIAITRNRSLQGTTDYTSTRIEKISGMAPKCKLVSIKVLDERGKGLASSLIAAIEHIQEINGYGRNLKIQGVNLSLGYSFEPEWFACGQSPLCVEVNRLVKSGVVVVAAAGNTGYGRSVTAFNGTVGSGLPFSINDPGNAELAITVGSTHRDMPFTYGVSYFSSKGPTGDGRLKPDLLAPGEKIISCASKSKRAGLKGMITDDGHYYIEDTGTSMAAPHVSGVIAAFLSVRSEYIGKPEEVKEIFMNTATDLKRDHYFQGKGLVDLMRAIQSI